ncbi:MAG: FecR domain-containing protein [Pseudomonadales bacterium]|nr:FecR domain-containing protein [Pseudomonadales bacterium]
MIGFKPRLVSNTVFSLATKGLFFFLTVSLGLVFCIPLSLATMPLDNEQESVAVNVPVGFVIVARGRVHAAGSDEVQRKLKRRSKIYAGDTISTSDSAKVQIKFSDGSIIALREGSSLRVDEFEFDPAGNNEKGFFTLLQGGFRAISGSIGKKNVADYRVNTPLATIGIRGTVYDAVLADGLVIGVWKGGVNIENEGGSLDLGRGTDFNYCVVNAIDEAPTGLLKAPAILVNTSFSLSDDEEESEEESQEESDGSVNNEGDENESDDESREERRGEREEGENPDAENSEGEQEQQPENAQRQEPSDGEADGRHRIARAKRAAGNGRGDGPKINRGVISGLFQDFVDFLPENFDIDVFETLLEEEFLADAGLDGFSGISPTILTDQELATVDRLGLAVFGRRPVALEGGGFKAFFSGAASDGSAGSPFFLDKSVFPSSDTFQTSIPNFVLKPNGSPFQILGNTNSLAQPPSVTFGLWNASAATPALLFPDMLDSGTRVNVENTVYWLTALPMNMAQLGGINGLVNYNITDFFAGSSSIGNILELELVVRVDFASPSNLVNGYMGIATGAPFGQQQDNFVDFWDIFFTGTLEGGVLNVQLDPMSERNEAGGVVGGLTGIVTGAGEGYLAGGFRFWQLDAMSQNLEWVSGIYGVAQGETRVTDAEITAVKDANRIALLTIDSARQFGFTDPIAGQDFAIFGGLSDSSGTSPTILGLKFGPDDIGFDIVGLGHVINPSNGATLDANNLPSVDNTGFSVLLDLPPGFNYGVWDGNINPVNFQVNPLDNTDIIAVDAPIFWLSVPNANSAALTAATGIVVYDNVLLLDGNGTAGPLIGEHSVFGLGVDFSSGQVVKGFIELWNGDQTNQQLWVIDDLQGEVTPSGFVELWPSGMGVNTYTCINFMNCQQDSGAYAEVAATLTDDGLASLSGVFKFVSLADSSQYLSGIFSLYHETRFPQSLAQFTSEGILVMQGETNLGLTRFGDSRDVEVFNPAAYRQYSTGGQLQDLVLREHDVYPFGTVFNMGSASMVNVGSDSASVGSRVDWGAWDASFSTPSEVLLNPADSTDKINVEVPSYWIVGTLTDPDVIQSRTGSISYTQMRGFAGSIFNIPLDSLSANMNVDFTNATFSGNVSASASSSTLGINFSGDLFDSHLDFNTVAGTLNSQSANVDISASFVGDAAQGIIGGFKVSDQLSSINTGEGVFLVTQ